MQFEFDPRKSATNKRKPGIDFAEAQGLWDDPDLIEVPAKTTDEPRFLVVGMIGGKHWSGIVTYRRESIRIISVRRAHKTEVAIYEAVKIDFDIAFALKLALIQLGISTLLVLFSSGFRSGLGNLKIDSMPITWREPKGRSLWKRPSIGTSPMETGSAPRGSSLHHPRTVRAFYIVRLE